MINFTATPSMKAAINKVRPDDRIKACKLAEDAFFKALKSPVMDDAYHPEIMREWAGEMAAAEVLYHFT